MFSLLNNLKNNHQRFVSTRRSRRQAHRRGSLPVEALEDRRVLSPLVALDVKAAAQVNHQSSTASHSAATGGVHASPSSTQHSGNAAAQAFCSNIPYLDVIQPSGSVVSAVPVNSNSTAVVHSDLENAASHISLRVTTEAATPELTITVAIDGCFSNPFDLLHATSTLPTPAPDDGLALPQAAFSKAFDGPVVLGGQPTNTSDTIVSRSDSSVQLPLPSPVTVPIQLIHLSLKSLEPLVIPPSVPFVPQFSAAELNLQTDGPIIGEALFQRLAPKSPSPQLSESNLQVSLNLKQFFGFSGGVTVATGDVNSDGFDDVIVGTGTGAALNGFNNPVPTGNNVVFANPAGTGNGANVPENGNVQAFASLSSGGLRRIEELLQNIKVLQDAKDDLGIFSDPLGGKRQSLQDQIDKKFAEIDDVLHGR